MPDRASATLAAILADPDADAPRLDHARDLRARGDARGEFVELQCALDRAEPPSAELARREAELLRVHGEAWLAEIGLDNALLRDPTVNGSWWRRFVSDPTGGPPYFRRGFLERLILHPEDLDRPAFLAAIPELVVRAVRWFVTTSPEEGTERWHVDLDRLAGLRHLAELELDAPFGASLPEDGFGALCASPLAKRLRSLQASPSGAWADALAGARPDLRTLGIGFTPLDPSSARTLADAGIFDRLETLVGHGSMGGESIRVLARSAGRLRRLVHGCLAPGDLGHLLGALPHLTEVSLHGRLDGDVAELARRPELRQLRSLTLTGPGSAALADSPHLGELRSLTLVCSTLVDEDLERLSRAAWPGLEAFALYTLAPPGVGPAGLAALARAPWLAGLRSLAAVRVAPGVAEALAASPGLRRLRELRLGENDLDDGAAVALAGSPVVEGLVHLDLNTNDIGADGFAALARSPRPGAVRCLNTWFNRGGDDVLAAAGYFATTPGHWCR